MNRMSEALAREVSDALPSVTWSSSERISEDHPGARGYVGRGPGIHAIAVASWLDDDSGERRWDGTAVLPRGVVLRLQPEIARRAFELAEQKEGE